MRIGIWSDMLNATTGYGENSRYLLKGLQARGHDVFELSLQWQGSPIVVEGIPVYSGHPDLLGSTIRRMEKPDIVVHIRDSWLMIDRFAIGKPYHPHKILSELGVKFVQYFPVQSIPAPVELANAVTSEGDFAIVHANCQKKTLVDQGAPADKIEVLHHGVDPDLFHPWPGNYETYGVPEDKKTILVVGSNTERKNLPGAFLVLKELLKKKIDINLYLHTQLNGYFALDSHIRALGLANSNRIYRSLTNESPNVTLWGDDEQTYVNMFRCAKVYLSMSWSEGFGVPHLQALTSGLPTIITDTPIHRELFSDFGARFIRSTQSIATSWGYEWLADVDSAALLVEAALKEKIPSKVTVPSNFLWPNIVKKFESYLEKWV